jgi:hypothetical protein
VASCQGRDLEENVCQSLEPVGHGRVARDHRDVLARELHHRTQLAQGIVDSAGAAHGLGAEDVVVA